MKILVSACLLGTNCKYNGKNNLNKPLLKLLEGHEVIPVCPELLGGLSCPRIPCEITSDGAVITAANENLTEAFLKGAKEAAKIADNNHIDLAILQKRSPSCGASLIYDGTFSGKLISGNGYFARELKRRNIPILEAESEN
jgi:uncharacterized protein YbbK (DUF523 family)